jgi:carbon storage regulator
MLVLSRRVDEEICIGDDIRLLVLSIQGGKVRLGVEAPEGIRIMRKELLLRDEMTAASGDLSQNRAPAEREVG